MSRSPTTADTAAEPGRLVDVGELQLHVVEAGPADGPLVVLLHGFPDHWTSWQAQLPALAAAGYRVAAPDLRGYNRSDTPHGVAAYRMQHHLADVTGLIRALGRTRAHIVGHDWGGAIAWAFAAACPDLTASLSVLNCPHPRTLRRALARPAQLLRSWYIVAFQVPVLPERLLMMHDARLLRRILRGRSEDEVARSVAAIRRGGGLTGPINYYRAARQDAMHPSPARPITAPTLVIWGGGDPVFEEDVAEPAPHLVPHARVARIPNAGHAVHNTAAAQVNELLLAQLGAVHGEPA